MSNVYKEIGPGSDASSLKGVSINDSSKATDYLLQYDGTEFVYIPVSDLGAVSGPGSSTDNALPRFNGTGGGTLQDSGIVVDDSDNITGINTATASTLVASALNAVSTNLAHAALLTPNAASSHSSSAISFNATPLSMTSTDLQNLLEEFAVGSLSGLIASPAAGTYTLDLAAGYASTITGLSINTVSGYITANVAINGTNVTGLTSINANATHTKVTASAANTVSVNNHVTLVFSGGSTPVDLSFTLHTLR